MSRVASHRALRVQDVSVDVSALLTLPADARACFVFAHGAGAGMAHPFMEEVAEGLAMRGIATLRYQFPYMEQGSKRPDPPAVAHRVVRAAVRTAVEKTRVPIIAGGKSFGGRMTSQVQAEAPLEGVQGLLFFGFPLHPVDKPSQTRADHLANVSLPMLFLQGTRDKLAPLPSMELVIDELCPSATLSVIEGADHGFDILVKSGRSHADVMRQMLDAVGTWTESLVKRSKR